MTVKEFLDKIVDNTVLDCNRNNLLPSPTLAQAIIESRYGTSTLATQANALFGIKANSKWTGKTYSINTKEYKNGQYVTVVAAFRAYDSWDESIIDHNQFLLKNKRYSNLVGVRDYKEYCKLIKQDGYATSPTYTQTLIDCIEKYNLAQYDVITEEKKDEEVIEPTTPFVKRKFNVHAGHNPSGMVACGSIGYLDESTENRNVCNGLITALTDMGHIAYDCTCNDGTSQKDILQKIVAKCNSHEVDLDISIHFNAISKETEKDGVTKGVEVWIHPNSRGTETETTAKAICSAVANLGFTNRGVKYSNGLYVLKNTKASAMLIECCFVDDPDDFELYDCGKMVKAILLGLTGSEGVDKPQVEDKDYYYTVVVGYYANESGALTLKKQLEDYGYLLNPNEDELHKGIVTSVQKIPKEYLG
jgi:N-acetylmuramoyl-L-alanine amidase|nr:MAG TPA: Cell wall hydrolase autolysin [Caudoviricetes sp.]